MIKNISDQNGFTIIELLISSVVFSVILLIAVTGIIEISRNYIKGYISANTENVTRNIVDEIAQGIQSSNPKDVIIPSASPLNGSIYWFCINGNRYTYQYNYIVGDINNNLQAFIKDKDPTNPPDNCNTPGLFTNTGAIELLSKHMELIHPSNGGILQKVTASVFEQNLYRINVDILYGDTGTFDPTIKKCNKNSDGGAFCNNSVYNTTVQSRTEIN